MAPIFYSSTKIHRPAYMSEEGVKLRTVEFILN